MTPQQVIDYCLSKKGAYLAHPFGPDSTVIKVGRREGRPARIFAQVFTLGGRDTLTLNCEMMTGQFYRQLFPGVVLRGYHCPPVQQPYFNTFPLDGAVPDDIILEMIEHTTRRWSVSCPGPSKGNYSFKKPGHPKGVLAFGQVSGKGDYSSGTSRWISAES